MPSWLGTDDFLYRRPMDRAIKVHFYEVILRRGRSTLEEDAREIGGRRGLGYSRVTLSHRQLIPLCPNRSVPRNKSISDLDISPFLKEKNRILLENRRTVRNHRVFQNDCVSSVPG